MKLLIKIIICISFLIHVTSVKAQKSNYSNVESYLKKNKFQLELYELSFCGREILKLLENDSLSRTFFEERINRVNNKHFDKYEKFIQNKELKILFDSLLNVKNNKKYVKSTRFIRSIKDDFNFSKEQIFLDYSEPFIGYVKYPDQIDDICLFTLINGDDGEVFRKLLRNENVSYIFNNWLKYGFIEFRGFSKEDTPKNEITDRIINSLNSKYKSSKQITIIKTLKMFKEARGQN